ncbi:hypothetical protein TWF970_003106 [Orbilia oligospora]|uniref:Uncharacterized protein n=1 Tax=Orbilia oligospora TaxID=2813651 RepID=A0A7C8VIY2_ORBOL|nr:hypothetical protein TWF970_003106 [Orbilia oligospora]
MSVFLRHPPNMAPLYDTLSILPGAETSLTCLILHASLVRNRLIASSNIQTKGGKTLAPELWLKIAEEHKLVETEEWIVVICDAISIEKTDTGGSGKILTCYQATPKEGWKFGSFDSRADVEMGQNWLNNPSQNTDIWVIDKTKKYNIELYERGVGTKPFCLRERYICPGCPTGAHWLARRFGAYIEWRIPNFELEQSLGLLNQVRLRLICPLCIGIDKMVEDKIWLNFFPRGELTPVGNSRAIKCNKWFEELGYNFRFEIREPEKEDQDDLEDISSSGEDDFS